MTAHHDGARVHRSERSDFRRDPDAVVQLQVERDDVEGQVGVVEELLPADQRRHVEVVRGEKRRDPISHQPVVVDDGDADPDPDGGLPLWPTIVRD